MSQVCYYYNMFIPYYVYNLFLYYVFQIISENKLHIVYLCSGVDELEQWQSSVWGKGDSRVDLCMEYLLLCVSARVPANIIQHKEQYHDDARVKKQISQRH